MSDENHDRLFAVSGRDLSYLVQQQERMSKGNLFEKYLMNEGYKLVEKDIYRNGDNEVIKLFANDGEQRYINSNKPTDSGNMIQFIMNRLNNSSDVAVKNELITYCLAVEKCLDFENHLLNQRKEIKTPRIVKEIGTKKRKL